MVLCTATFLILLASPIFAASSSISSNILPACPSTEDSIYDYIVVGAGAGGGPVAARLAENGFSVLLVETGEDESGNVNTTSLFAAFSAMDDPKIDLDYRIKEYPANFPVQRNDQWYPRLSSSTTPAKNSIAGMRQQFDTISHTFNDPSWSRDNMQKYWALIENNLYLDPTVPNPDHGFNGWLNSSRASAINFTSTDQNGPPSAPPSSPPQAPP
ncbi:hypothetical protein R3P38DRAFT_3228481 [Favolaschia claudopus]|uniref:Glucose-methanol-choline oxidoreductase N-terminal domain-containing protein n=1 Tax=Favolaschia claudopus TaxID=2862362 RepID=A0AAV9ZPT2_9AGAR